MLIIRSISLISVQLVITKTTTPTIYKYTHLVLTGKQRKKKIRKRSRKDARARERRDVLFKRMEYKKEKWF